MECINVECPSVNSFLLFVKERNTNRAETPDKMNDFVFRFVSAAKLPKHNSKSCNPNFKIAPFSCNARNTHDYTMMMDGDGEVSLENLPHQQKTEWTP